MGVGKCIFRDMLEEKMQAPKADSCQFSSL